MTEITMPIEIQEILLVIAFFVLGVGVGYCIEQRRLVQEAQFWRDLARRSALLVRLADTLSDDRVNHDQKEERP